MNEKFYKYEDADGYYIVKSNDYNIESIHFSGTIVESTFDKVHFTDVQVGKRSERFVCASFTEVSYLETDDSTFSPSKFYKFESISGWYVVKSQNYDSTKVEFAGTIVAEDINDEIKVVGYQSKRFTVSDFVEISADEVEKLKKPEPKKDDIVLATRYKDGYQWQTKYYGRVEGTDKHIVDFDDAYAMIVDKVEVLSTITKEEAKSEVGKLFSMGKTITPDNIKNIIDRIV